MKTSNSSVYVVEYEEENNEIIAKWIDDPDSILTHTPQDKFGRIARVWPREIRVGLQDGGIVADVLHSPYAFILCQSGKEKIEKDKKVNQAVEWLPIKVNGVGVCYVCHPHLYIPFQRRSIYDQDAETKNVFGIQKFILDDNIELPPIFLMQSPLDSVAGKLGYGTGRIYLSTYGKNVFDGLWGVKVLSVDLVY